MHTVLLLILLVVAPQLLAKGSELMSRLLTKNPGPEKFQRFGYFAGLAVLYVVETFLVFCSGINITTGDGFIAMVINYPDFIYYIPPVLGVLVSGFMACVYYPANKELLQAMEE